MTDATPYPSKTRQVLIGTIVAVWFVTFAAVGIGTMEVSKVCGMEDRADSVPGHSWSRDPYNNCEWTLYSGTYPFWRRAPSETYRANGFVPPPKPTLVDRWQMAMVLVAASLTGGLSLWLMHLRPEGNRDVAVAPAHIDAT
ncbi:MAG: hypothetical protein BMS9Abin07_0602 [Acidimicrobiia bacterium]|nr:MAG: hypothetical protein BMS9Abin07_0602 [Acidimicrobiia bacterium]